jgi:beta-phosphoglucomutase
MSYDKLEAVVFDCDGVLVDSEPLHYRAFQAVLGPLGLGHSYDAYLERYIGFDDRDAFLEAFRENGRELDDATLARLIRAKEEVLQGIMAQGVSGFPGVVALVRELAANRVPLAVASGALRQEVNGFIKALGLTGFFSVIVSADEVARSKPHPETYLKVLEHFRNDQAILADLNPQCCIAIEDTPSGIASAKDAGLYVIGVTNSFPEDQLPGADQVVASLEELNFSRLAQSIERQNSPLGTQGAQRTIS